ncbi:MAG: helix-turn-helix domain containing protein [Burkholderiales bacterium]|nr:helix-turn-helix domain containing protein [Burkholderiales bacterium]
MRRLRTTDLSSLCSLIASTAQGSPELRVLHRAHCILLANQTPGCYGVARFFGESPRTVERWVRNFNTGGAAALREHHSGGRRRRVEATQLSGLAQDLARSPRSHGYAATRWTGVLLARHLEAAYCLRLGVRQCQRLLRSLRAPGGN